MPEVAQRQHTAEGPHHTVGEGPSSPTPLGAAKIGHVVSFLPQLVAKEGREEGWREGRRGEGRGMEGGEERGGEGRVRGFDLYAELCTA